MNQRGAKSPVPPEIALANDVFDQFCAAGSMKTILGHYRHLCDLLSIKPTNYPQFYPKLKSKLKTWKAQALWNKFDKRASHKCYNRGKACSNHRVFIIGAGPCGLRAAIEAQLLGAKVVVLEKRDRFSRNNVLHLWPFVIHDLKSLGAKKFFGKFCAGSIDHISIRQLQCILMKVALILGVEIHEGVGFESLLAPPSNQDEEKIGWRAVVSPPEHPVAQYEFNVLVGADGKRNTLEGFKRKEFRGKLAIAITANFINKKSEAEARVEEISGVAFIFNQKFFKDLYAETGIDLENIVYYKDDTHYFVMTAKKQSLLDKGVILQDFNDTVRLLSQDNIDKDALKSYARQAADFSTDYRLPSLEYAVNHYGQCDVAMFDFTSMYAAENASRFMERHGHPLLMTLVGDSLLEPFWPTGSGCARGFLSSMDACWAVRSWASGNLNPLEVLAERESIYRILGQTTPENLHRDHAAYSVDPTTRYPNLNLRSVLPVQVKGLYDTDDQATLEMYLKAPATMIGGDQPKKRRRRDMQVHPDILLFWLKQQVTDYETVHITDLTSSFKDGLALCAIIHRYRPDLCDFYALKSEDVRGNNQRAFDILEKELGIPPILTGEEMEETDLPDQMLMESYLSQLYEIFRREIPHIQHPRLPEEDIMADRPPVRRDHLLESVKSLHRLTSEERTTSLLSRLATPSGTRKRSSLPRDNNSPALDSSLSRGSKTRKRRSGALPGTVAARKSSIEQIARNRDERMSRQREQRERDTRQFVKSMQLLSAYTRLEPGEELAPSTTVDEDYGIFMYRQSAPDFKDRVKDIEKLIFHPEREVRAHSGIKMGALDEDISGRVKNLEEKFRGGPAPGMKPKDLYRAIGKIEKTDWNVKEIEKKIEENKYGKSSKTHSEKVPKWSREQFADKFSAVERKLRKKGFDEAAATKYAQIDQSLKQLERKIKEGSVLEQGQRGSNKVSAMAAQLATKTQDATDNKALAKPVGFKPVAPVPSQNGTEVCHFCNKRVYLMERMNAEGRYFHRGCFRCEYCSINLRLGNYAFDREGKFGHRFFCTQHFGLAGTMKQRTRRKNEDATLVPAPRSTVGPGGSSLRSPEAVAAGKLGSPIVNATLGPTLPTTPDMTALKKEVNSERDGTPERIEIEVDGDEAPSVMDEDEWTDRNFGASCAENNSCDESSDEDDETEEYSEAMDVPLNADETLRLAEDWTRKYARRGSGDEDEGSEEDTGSEGDESEEEELFSYQESDSQDEESTATEGEEEIKAREMRKQEVFLQVPDQVMPTDSDTEVNNRFPHVDSIAPALSNNRYLCNGQTISSPLDGCSFPLSHGTRDKYVSKQGGLRLNRVDSVAAEVTSDDRNRTPSGDLSSGPDLDSFLDSPLSDSQDKLFESLVAKVRQEKLEELSEASGGFKTEDDSYDALEEDDPIPSEAKDTCEQGRTKSLDSLDEMPASDSIENLFLGLRGNEVTKSTENFFSEVESLDRLQNRLHYGHPRPLRSRAKQKSQSANGRGSQSVSEDLIRGIARTDTESAFDELYNSAVQEHRLAEMKAGNCTKEEYETKSSNSQGNSVSGSGSGTRGKLSPPVSNLCPDTNPFLLSSDNSDSSRPVTPNLPVMTGKILVSIKPTKSRRSHSRSPAPGENGREKSPRRRKSRSKTPNSTEALGEGHSKRNSTVDNDHDSTRSLNQGINRSTSRSQTPDNVLSESAATPRQSRRFQRLLNRSDRAGTPDITLNDSENSLLDDSHFDKAAAARERISLRKSPLCSRRQSIPQGVKDEGSGSRSKSHSRKRHDKSRERSGNRDKSNDRSRNRDKSRDTSDRTKSDNKTNDTASGGSENGRTNASKTDGDKSETSRVTNSRGIVKSKLRDVRDILNEQSSTPVIAKADRNNNCLVTDRGRPKSMMASHSKPSTPQSSPPPLRRCPSQSKPTSPVSSPPRFRKFSLASKPASDSTPASPMFNRKARQMGPAQINPIFDVNLLRSKYFSNSNLDLSGPPPGTSGNTIASANGGVTPARARSEFFGELSPNRENSKVDGSTRSPPETKYNSIADKTQLMTQYLANDTRSSRENLSKGPSRDSKSWDKKELIGQYLGKLGKGTDAAKTNEKTDEVGDKEKDSNKSDLNSKSLSSNNSLGSNATKTSSSNTKSKDPHSGSNFELNLARIFDRTFDRVRASENSSALLNGSDEGSKGSERHSAPPRKLIIADAGSPEVPVRSRKKMSRENSKVDGRDVKRQNSNKECIVM